MADEKESGSGGGAEIPLPRMIVLVGEIDWAMVEKVAEQITVYNTVSDQPILVHITSPGGNIDPAMAVYDLLALSPAPVITCVFGGANSSASIIAQAGVKRLIAPHGTILIHTGSIGLEGRFNHKDLAKLKKDAWTTNDRVYRLYAERTGNTRAQIRAWCEAETEMNARQALKRGFVDAILADDRLRKPKKAKTGTA